MYVTSYYVNFSNNKIYWKDIQSREVDFVIKKDGRVDELIQVTNTENAMQLEERKSLGF